MGPASRNRQLIERFWSDLYRRDFDRVGGYFAPDGHYKDVPAPDAGAFGAHSNPHPALALNGDTISRR